MLGKSEKRATSVCVRLSLREFSYIEQAAAEREMKVTRLVRMRAFYRRLPRKIIDVSPKTYLELAYINSELDEATQRLYQIVCHRGAEGSQSDELLPRVLQENVEVMIPKLTDLLEEIGLQIVTLGLKAQADALTEGLRNDL